MASTKITIKAVRRFSHAHLLPDGTLASFHETVRTDNRRERLAQDVEVEEGFAASVTLGVRDATWDQLADFRSRTRLLIGEEGYLPVLRGAHVSFRAPHTEEGSPITQRAGIALGYVRAESAKLSVSFTTVKGLSQPLEVSTGTEKLPTFAEIVAAGSYCDYPLAKAKAAKAKKGGKAAECTA